MVFRRSGEGRRLIEPEGALAKLGREQVGELALGEQREDLGRGEDRPEARGRQIWVEQHEGAAGLED